MQAMQRERERLRAMCEKSTEKMKKKLAHDNNGKRQNGCKETDDKRND